MTATTLLSDNGVTSGVTGYTLTGGNDGTLQLQTTTAGGAATTAITLDASQNTTVAGNLTLSGTGKRITGGFSDATISNRAAFQSSTTNGQTILALIPNGTSQISGISAISSSSDPNNSSEGSFAVVGGSDVRFNSSIRGTGTYLPMIFLTSGAERMRIDTSGNVGIGTSSPASKLQVSHAGDLASGVAIFGDQTTPASITGIYLRSTTKGNINFASGGVLAFNGAGDGSAERARIDSSGNLLVGKTAADGSKGSTVGVEIVPASTSSFVNDSNEALLISRRGTDGNVLLFRKATTTVGSVSVTTVATLYNTTSDYRLKTVIGAVTDAGSRIDALEPVEYEWKADGSRTRGFLAHKFQEVYAGSVSGEKDAVDANGNPVYQSMQASSSEVIADLVAEIQSLRQRLAALENK